MQITASELRRNLFRILDRCIESGEPVLVARRHGTVALRPHTKRLKVHELPSRDGVLVNGDTLDGFSPSEWSP